jgi:hypothetical protein
LLKPLTPTLYTHPSITTRTRVVQEKLEDYRAQEESDEHLGYRGHPQGREKA